MVESALLFSDGSARYDGLDFVVYKKREQASKSSLFCHLSSSNKGATLDRVDICMPKMKTKSSAKKRFRVRPGGTVKRGQAFKRHILTKKTTKNKRQLRGAVQVHETNMDSVRAMMPFA